MKPSCWLTHVTPQQPPKKDYLWDWKCRVYSSRVTRSGSWVCVQSSEQLQAPALELGTSKPEFLGRSLVLTFKKEQTTLMYLHREILVFPSFVLFCCISKQVEKRCFSNCCCVHYIFSQLQAAVSSGHCNCLKWYTVNIFCFLENRKNLCQPWWLLNWGIDIWVIEWILVLFFVKIKKNSQSISKVKSIQLSVWKVFSVALSIAYLKRFR